MWVIRRRYEYIHDIPKRLWIMRHVRCVAFHRKPEVLQWRFPQLATALEKKCQHVVWQRLPTDMPSTPLSFVGDVAWSNSTKRTCRTPRAPVVSQEGFPTTSQSKLNPLWKRDMPVHLRGSFVHPWVSYDSTDHAACIICSASPPAPGASVRLSCHKSGRQTALWLRGRDVGCRGTC